MASDMKILLDTSVLIAAVLHDHVHHQSAREWLNHAHLGSYQLIVSGHSLAEMYSTLTRMPRIPPITASDANQLIHHDILSKAGIASLSGADYVALLQEISTLGLTGGIVYDAVILKAATLAQVKHVVTLNVAHFNKVNHSSSLSIVDAKSVHPTALLTLP